MSALAFAYWIAGYQKFYEPIVRAWFEENGLKSAQRRTVSAKELVESIRRLECGDLRFCIDPAKRTALVEVLRGRSRVQMDLLFEKNDGLVSGECKSWGGLGSAITWQFVEKEFVHGAHGHFLLVSEFNGREVVESYLVLWERAAQHDLIETNLTRIYGRPIRLFYLPEILSNLGPRASQERMKRLRMLDEAVELVKAKLCPAAT